MSNEILLHSSGNVICWANSDQYVNGVYGMFFPRTHNIDLRSLAANAARQGSKADLGVKRAQGYTVKASVEFGTAPTASGPVEFYWSSSPTTFPASGNAGGGVMVGGTFVPYVSGVDGPYTPGAGAEADIDEWKQDLTFVGILSAAADGVGYVQSKVVNSHFVPPERCGQFIVKNDASQSFSAGGSGMYIALIPITDELQG